jgi:uncharacterized protein
MLLDISRLRTVVVDVNRRYEPEAFADLTDDFKVIGPTEIAGTVRREKGTHVVLHSRVTSAMEVTCGRCLEPYVVPVSADVETRFVPPAEFAKVTAETAAKAGLLTAGAVAGDDDEDVEPHGEGHVVGLAEYRDEAIDLGEVIREQLYLALPMKPLCQESCKGLCPVCGANRNRETCHCQHQWEDPRMAALAEWKSRNEKT